MGLFKSQLANVVEWEEYRDDCIFWKWTNSEIKKGSRLIIRAGQDAIFMYNGRIEGIFKDEGSFDIESDIIPFLSTLNISLSIPQFPFKSCCCINNSLIFFNIFIFLP